MAKRSRIHRRNRHLSLSTVPLILLSKSLSSARAQAISQNTPVPPLQWLNLTNDLNGYSAPLRDAVIGYEDTYRNLVIYGGESADNIAQSQTYILNLDTLTWSSPSPTNDDPTGNPPARSRAVYGYDFSSSYRDGLVVIGGQDASGQPLSDAWEFSFQYEFWSQITLLNEGPSFWSASGGRDPRTAADISGNTTFYVAGGTNGTYITPLSELWELQVSGFQSSNNVNDLYGTWTSTTIDSGPGLIDQANTVVSTYTVSFGGCNTTADGSDSCASQSGYVVDPVSSSGFPPAACPAPRYGGVMVPNMNTYPVSTFPSQVFLLLGTFNSSLWDDEGGLQMGEVDVLDYQTGQWARILPAGDPGTTGIPAYPSPRTGAVAYAFPQALVGYNGDRSVVSDTIVFGGEDESGNYLNEVWLLRAYNGEISSSNATWGGPSGNLQTGVNATGAGVTVQYLAQCATQVAPLPPPTSSTAVPNPSGTSPAQSPPPSSEKVQTYDVSVTHKLLAPLSIALIMPAVLMFRAALPSRTAGAAHVNKALIYSSALIALAAYGLGIGGLVSSFTSIYSTYSTSSVAKRSNSSLILQTAHGIVGLALVAALYGALPILYLAFVCQSSYPRKVAKPDPDTAEDPASFRTRVNSSDTAEKLASTIGSAPAANTNQYPPSTPTGASRARLHSWGGSSMLWPTSRSREGRISSDSESIRSASPQRAFEVVNRPARIRRASTNGLTYPSLDAYQRVPVAPRSLGDMDWLDRRRSLSAVGELDFAMNETRRAGPPTPATPDMLSTRGLMPKMMDIRPSYDMPSPFDIFLRIAFHLLLLALTVLSLIALWSRAPTAIFAVFIVWTALFYGIVFSLAWHGRPRDSVLTLLLARFRTEPPPPTASPGTPTSRPLSIGTDQLPFPTTDVRGPYLHQPLYRPAGLDDVSTSQGPRSDTEDEDEDEDEDSRQRRIEEEMARREVSIVTVPKRRLWITNPS